MSVFQRWPYYRGGRFTEVSIMKESTAIMTKFSLYLSFTVHHTYTTGQTDPLELICTVSRSFPYSIHCQLKFNVRLTLFDNFQTKQQLSPLIKNTK